MSRDDAQTPPSGRMVAETPMAGRDNAEFAMFPEDVGREAPLDITKSEVEWGLRFNHWMAVRAQEQLVDHELTLYAIAKLLVGKGVMSVEEIDAMRLEVGERVDREQRGEPRVHLASGINKYASAVVPAEVDCAARMPHCHAACCRFSFALSRQDLDEGVVRWNYSTPYLIRHGPDGYCVHNGGDGGCAVHQHRPLPCRTFDCRGDTRIWVDFDAMVPHPSLATLTRQREES